MIFSFAAETPANENLSAFGIFSETFSMKLVSSTRFDKNYHYLNRETILVYIKKIAHLSLLLTPSVGDVYEVYYLRRK